MLAALRDDELSNRVDWQLGAYFLRSGRPNSGIRNPTSSLVSSPDSSPGTAHSQKHRVFALNSSQMDEKGNKGISLRQKRGGKLGSKIQISAPTLISAPASASNATDISSKRSQPSTLPGAGLPGNPRPRERPRDDKTADLVKRRYSTRFTTLPTDWDSTASPVPSVPSLPTVPSQFAVQPPARGGKLIEGRTIKADPAVLKDPKFEAEDCTVAWYDCVNCTANLEPRCFHHSGRCFRARN
jgi:hypothetical protein